MKWRNTQCNILISSNHSPHAVGLEIIAWALNGTPVSKSGDMHAGRRESIIAFSCFLWIDISVGPDGIIPLFLAISITEITQLAYGKGQFS